MGDFEDKLAPVLAGCVPGFTGMVSAERLSGGASQETYRLLVDTEQGARRLALRRAAGGAEAALSSEYPGLRTEALLMRSARAAGIPEPEVLGELEPEHGLGEGFVMEWLEGETLGARIVRSSELDGIRPRLARQCGEILGRIHAIDLEATGLDQRLRRLDPEEFVDQVFERYQLLRTPQPMIDYTARWLREHLPSEHRMTLVHNDFRNGNLMVTPQGISAVLDWETAHIGDPMRDLGWICTNSWRFGRSELPVGGFGTMEDLFEGYRASSGLEVDPEHVHFWIVFGSYWWAAGCLGMARHYRTGPDRTVERPAIGRRSSECQVDCVNLLIPGPVERFEPLGDESPADESPLADENDDELPRIDELLRSVRDFLRDDVMTASAGRQAFLARVAANSLDVVLRDRALGHRYRQAEHERLRVLLGREGDLSTLRWELVRALRSGAMALEAPGLAEHLRATVVDQVAIDQPRYSGLRTALEHAGA